MTSTLNGVDELRSAVGTEFGASDWVEVTQDRINQFAEATGDFQWIHVDEERAKDGPFGATIAHGFLTLSLAPTLMPQVVVVEGRRFGVNYGLGKVRFPNPVPVGSKVRLHVTLAEATDMDDGGVQVTWRLVTEVQGVDKPACVADLIVRLYF